MPRRTVRRSERDDAERRRPGIGEDGQALSGVYCAGWIKRGPTGVIGTNKKDATETVEACWQTPRPALIGGTAAPAETVEALFAERGIDAVIYSGWEAIDAAERAAGEPHGARG